MKLPASDYIHLLATLVQTASATTRQGVNLHIDAACQHAIDMTLQLPSTSSKAIVIGNGGSAAIASHMVNDLCKSAAISAMTFNDFSLITALANDEGYERAYEACVQQWAQPCDLLIAISSSGKSQNILRAASAATIAGAQVITLTGFRSDNPLRNLGDLNIHIAAEDYGMVELAHSIIAHQITDAVSATRKQIRSQENQYDNLNHDTTHNHAQATNPHHGRRGIRRGRASA